MKVKLTTIILAAWYALLTVGVQVQTHYCEAEFALVSIENSGNNDKDCCHDEGCGDHEDCCSFEEVFLVLDEDHKQPSQLFSFVAENPISIPVQSVIAGDLPIPNPELFVTDSGPPLFLMNCSFTLYG